MKRSLAFVVLLLAPGLMAWAGGTAWSTPEERFHAPGSGKDLFPLFGR